MPVYWRRGGSATCDLLLPVLPKLREQLSTFWAPTRDAPTLHIAKKPRTCHFDDRRNLNKLSSFNFPLVPSPPPAAPGLLPCKYPSPLCGAPLKQGSNSGVGFHLSPFLNLFVTAAYPHRRQSGSTASWREKPSYIAFARGDARISSSCCSNRLPRGISPS